MLGAEGKKQDGLEWFCWYRTQLLSWAELDCWVETLLMRADGSSQNSKSYSWAMSWKSAVDSGESAGSPLQVTSHCWCVILLLKTQELALTVIFTRGGTGCCMMQCVPSNPTAEEAVQFVLVLALCAEDNPPDCRVSATKTSAVIIKTQRIKLACGKNRKRCSPENNLSLLLQDVHWSMPIWLQVISTY